MEDTERLDEIVEEIKGWKSIETGSYIEIGKLLIEAKESVAHGEWGKWLEEKVQYSQRTAENYIRIADAFGANPQSVSNLSVTHLIKLLKIPASDREQFMQEYNVSQMTCSKLDLLIKECLGKTDTKESKRITSKERIKALEEENARLKIVNDEQQAKISELEALIESMKAETEKAA